ncbi:MAG: pilin [bacterium]
MKKYLFPIFIWLVLFGGIALAQENGVSFSDPLLGDKGSTGVYGIVKNITTVVFGLVGLITVLSFLLAGYRLIVAAGNEKQIKAATHVLKWNAVGLLVIFSSYALVTFLISTASETKVPEFTGSTIGGTTSGTEQGEPLPEGTQSDCRQTGCKENQLCDQTTGECADCKAGDLCHSIIACNIGGLSGDGSYENQSGCQECQFDEQCQLAGQSSVACVSLNGKTKKCWGGLEAGKICEGIDQICRTYSPDDINGMCIQRNVTEGLKGWKCHVKGPDCYNDKDCKKPCDLKGNCTNPEQSCVNNKCSSPPGLGANCDPNRSNPCQSGYWCVPNTDPAGYLCLDEYSNGSNCKEAYEWNLPNGLCPNNLLCLSIDVHLGFDTRECHYPLKAGELCKNNENLPGACEAGTKCLKDVFGVYYENELICFPLQTAGDVCDNDSYCADGYACLSGVDPNNPTKRTCVNKVSGLPSGSVCGSLEEPYCYDPKYCYKRIGESERKCSIRLMSDAATPVPCNKDEENARQCDNNGKCVQTDVSNYSCRTYLSKGDRCTSDPELCKKNPAVPSNKIGCFRKQTDQYEKCQDLLADKAECPSSPYNLTEKCLGGPNACLINRTVQETTVIKTVGKNTCWTPLIPKDQDCTDNTTRCASGFICHSTNKICCDASDTINCK